MMIDPDEGEPSIAGMTSVSFRQPICVRSPLYVCELHRWALPSKHRTGWQTSGKSSKRRSLSDSSIRIELMAFSARSDSAAKMPPNFRWP